MKSRLSLPSLVLLAGLIALSGCASQPPRPHPGYKLKLEAVQHDYATTYVYREVPDPAAKP